MKVIFTLLTLLIFQTTFSQFKAICEEIYT